MPSDGNWTLFWRKHKIIKDSPFKIRKKHSCLCLKKTKILKYDNMRTEWRQWDQSEGYCRGPGISHYLRDGSYIKRNRKVISAFEDQMFKIPRLTQRPFYSWISTSKTYVPLFNTQFKIPRGKKSSKTELPISRP